MMMTVPCTMEFRMITVVVVDEMNVPVLGLTTVVKDDSGKVYDVYNDPLIFPGQYTVMDDNYVKRAYNPTQEVSFYGRKRFAYCQRRVFRKHR